MNNIYTILILSIIYIKLKKMLLQKYKIYYTTVVLSTYYDEQVLFFTTSIDEIINNKWINTSKIYF